MNNYTLEQATDGIGNRYTNFLSWRSRIFGRGTLFAGSFSDRPVGPVIINMAKEIKGGDFRVEVVDFQVPTVKKMSHALVAAYAAHMRDQDVYVHCMGGIGRTGTFLACWLKVVGYKDPIGHVRVHYHPHACETKEQVAWVEGFPVWRVRLAWLWLRFLPRVN